MDLYALFQNLSAAIIRFFAEGAWSRMADRTPAQLAAIARSDAVLSGISAAQVFSAMLSAGFAFLLMVAIFKKRALTVKSSDAAEAVPSEAGASAPAAGALRPRWELIRARLESPQEAEWKVAVMEADTLVDDALARAGFPGDSFGDRLTNIQPGALASLDGIWWAHRIRNRLAHEMDYFLRYTEARQAVGYYEQALTELHLL